MSLLKKIFFFFVSFYLWLIGIGLIVVGIVAFSAASIFFILSGFLILPYTRKLVSRVFKERIFGKPVFIYVCAAVFFIAGSLIQSTREQEKARSEWATQKDSIKQNLSVALSKNEIKTADELVERYKYIVTGDSEWDKLTEQLASIKKATADSARAAAARGSYSKVVSKIGTILYLANGEQIIFDNTTLLHINEQLYPKIEESYIQVGYSCRAVPNSRIPSLAAEVFCNR